MYLCGRFLTLPIGRVRRRLGWLVGALAAFFAASQPVQALVINATYDTSWTSGAPAGAYAVVSSVIAEYEADFSNPVTVTLQFGWGTLDNSPINADSGGVTTYPQTVADFTAPTGNEYTLAQTEALYATAVGLQPTNAVLGTANSNLPATYPNPGGSTKFFVPDAEYLALTGTAQNADTVNAYEGFGTTPGGASWYFGSGVPPSGEYDFMGFVEHEVSHALGRVDSAFDSTGGVGGNPPYLTTLDFLKYDCGTSTLDPTFSTTCFSYDGGATDPGNMTFSNNSDSSDWINFASDSYNWTGFAGQQQTVSSVDIIEMCALGWNDAACSAQVAAPEPGTLTLFASPLFGLAALRRWRRSANID